MLVRTPLPPGSDPRSIRVPFIKKPIPAGDAIARITQAVRIQPCGGCERRRQALNQRLIFKPL